MIGTNGQVKRLQTLDALGQPRSTRGSRRQSTVVGIPRFNLNGDGLLKSLDPAMVNAISMLNADPRRRASEPFTFHPWVYVTSMAAAVNLSQAPFGFWLETEEGRQQRVSRAKRAGLKDWAPKRGRERKAVERYLRQPQRWRGQAVKGVEAFPEHPLAPLFSRPNPTTSGSELWQGITIYMFSKGEAFLIGLNKDDSPVAPGQIPEELWLADPADMEEITTKPQGPFAPKHGRLMAWKYRTKSGRQIVLPLSMVTQFKFVNPGNPHRGLAPTVALASTIDSDMAAMTHNRSVLNNGADPGTVLVAKEGWADESDREATEKALEERHGGVFNRGNTLLLSGDLSFERLGMTPKDMDWLNLRKFDRDEITSGMRVPKATLGVTDDLNLATQLAQDFNFWDKTLRPLISHYEDVIDQSMLFRDPDTVMAGFDLANIEALRAGLMMQIETADKLSGPNLHAPPRTSYEVVGLDVPDYGGDDKALVSPLLAPADTVAGGTSGLFGPGEPSPAPEEEPEEAPEIPEEEVGERTAKRGPSIIRVRQASRVWLDLMKNVQQPSEALFRKSWKTWGRNQERAQLALFDETVEEIARAAGLGVQHIRGLFDKQGEELLDPEDVDRLLLPLEDSQNALGEVTRPSYTASLELSFEFTVSQLGGIAVFELDDPAIMSVLQRRSRKLIGTAPVTNQRNMRASFLEGIEAGESVAQLRARVKQTYGVTVSEHKTLQVARTESAGFMNEARDEMFGLQGIQEMEWVTAGDESVREDHVTLGDLGPQPRGTNYMAALGQSGVLMFPGDSQGPAAQVINCRCMHAPVL